MPSFRGSNCQIGFLQSEMYQFYRFSPLFTAFSGRVMGHGGATFTVSSLSLVMGQMTAYQVPRPDAGPKVA